MVRNKNWIGRVCKDITVKISRRLKTIPRKRVLYSSNFKGLRVGKEAPALKA